MYAFDAYTGSQLWFTGLPQYDEWTPAVDDNFAYAYVGENSPALYAADRHTGEIIYKINDLNFDWHGWSMDLAPVLTSDNSIFVIQDGRLIKFDLILKEISWENNGNYSGQPSYSNGIVYAINSGALSAADSNTGEVLWLLEVPSGNLTGNIIVTDTHVLVSSSSTTYAVDLNTHEEVWSYPVSGHLSLGENALYIATSNGNLHCIAYEPFEVPVAIAGPDRVEYSNVTLDASASYDPDGNIVSYSWQIDQKEGTGYSLTVTGKTVDVSDLNKGFYNVVLTVVDNEGFFSTDDFVLAIMGPEPQCKYNYEDVEIAYSTGCSSGKNLNQAEYDSGTKKLSIPGIFIDDKVQCWEMKRNGKSNDFTLLQVIENCETGCSIDIDLDGIPATIDNCPDNCNTQQTDADSDGIGDVCDDPGDDGCVRCGSGTLCEVEC
jgi:hypothetical protein